MDKTKRMMALLQLAVSTIEAIGYVNRRFGRRAGEADQQMIRLIRQWRMDNKFYECA